MLELFFFELGETNFKDFLLVVFMSQLHEDENIVVLGFGDHIFSEDFNESLNLQKLDYGVIFDHF